MKQHTHTRLFCESWHLQKLLSPSFQDLSPGITCSTSISLHSIIAASHLTALIETLNRTLSSMCLPLFWRRALEGVLFCLKIKQCIKRKKRERELDTEHLITVDLLGWAQSSRTWLDFHFLHLTRDNPLSSVTSGSLHCPWLCLQEASVRFYQNRIALKILMDNLSVLGGIPTVFTCWE